jgi:DNA-binding response OmpR family regulator
MLPSRAYADPLSFHPATSSSSSATAAPPRPVLVLALSPADAEHFAASRFTHLAVHDTADAVRAIERARPRVVTVDLDVPQFDAAAICAAAVASGTTSVLAITDTVSRVPPLLKAGCHGVLLKPFSPAIVASRLGRLVRESPLPAPRGAAPRLASTNRVWPDAVCPTCRQGSAVSFEFASYRRMWYACLLCNAVWLGPRRE